MKGPIRQTSDQKNRVRKRRIVGRIYEMKYTWKGHNDRNRHKNRTKRVGNLKKKKKKKKKKNT